jgi:nitrate/TMAO reductase-like tetraheme cytochrome c subunit
VEERRRGRGLPLAAKALVAIVLLFALVGGLLVAARATDASSFCMTCHEMAPYNEAWAAGPHARVECVECHVAASTMNRLAHKFVALGEVRAHLFGDPRFPMGGISVPDSRCVPCHRSIEATAPAGSRFSHALHASKARCWECHTTTGHAVSLDALRAAGVLAPDATPTPAAVAGTRGGTPITGHVRTTCIRCHDQSRMACATCHKAPHKDRGACTTCHRPGKAFAFVHPTSGDCAGCHKPKHAPRGACTQCHRVGAKWTFYHPASTACASCHKPPANHYGSDCVRCHKPSVPFARTVFRHPSTGAPHGYRSFPCSNCHPSGPPAVSCTCHGGGRPSGD